MSEDIKTVILRIAVKGPEVTCAPLSPVLQYGIDAGFLLAAPVSIKTEKVQIEEIHLTLTSQGFILLTTETTYFRDETGEIRNAWVCGYDAYYSGIDAIANEFSSTTSFTTQQRVDWSAGWQYAQLESTGVTQLQLPLNLQIVDSPPRDICQQT